MSDTDLLQRYVDDGSSDAFATLVARHLDLLYSVARRHVGASSTAKDIAQSVFIELARNARRIKPVTPIIAWLHVVSCRVALNAIRAKVRRESRERISAELTAMESNESKWIGLEPFLDEAVESLNPTDRSAILVRYFENKSLREVGAALGTNERAAQKRVTRAVEQLRTFFVRRGIPVSAVALTTDLSALALHTAPLGLGSAISAAAAVLPIATATATQLVMATAQKILIAASLTIAIGGGTSIISGSAPTNTQALNVKARAPRSSPRFERRGHAPRPLRSLTDSVPRSSSTSFISCSRRISRGRRMCPLVSRPTGRGAACICRRHAWQIPAVRRARSQPSCQVHTWITPEEIVGVRRRIAVVDEIAAWAARPD